MADELDLRPIGERLVVRSGAAALAVEAAGDGPAVVFLHAGVADRRSWYPVAARLVADHRVVLWDRRGFGETVVDRPERYDGVDDLTAVLDALEVERAVVVGNSMGGMLAVDVALALPDRTSGLMLVGSAPTGAPWPDAGLDLSDIEDALGAARASGDVDAMNRVEARVWLDGVQGGEGRVDGAARELFLDMNGIALRAGDVGSEVERPDAWPRLDELAVPVTWLEGALDEPEPAMVAEEARELVADLRVEVLDGVAHLPSLERPGVVADLVRDVVDRAG